MNLQLALALIFLSALLGVLIGLRNKRRQIAAAREEARMEYAWENGHLLGWAQTLEEELNERKAKEAIQ